MSKKKVLVIGGTGIAGQFITDYLLHYHDICELFIASRGIHKISEKKVVNPGHNPIPVKIVPRKFVMFSFFISSTRPLCP